MSEYRDGELVHQLIEATQQGRIAWEPTANVDEFTTSFNGKYSVIVAKRAGLYALRMLDDAERELLSLEHEEHSALQYAEDIGPPSGRSPYVSISELFYLARRTALHVDKAIDDVLQALRG